MIKEFYENKYKGEKGYKEHLAPWHREVINILEFLKPGPRLLEVGCGNGRLLKEVAKLGFDTIGVDISSEAVKICRSKGLKAECIDVEKGLPYTEQFDVCIGVEIIEHLFDHYHFLNQLNKCLKPHGIAIITTPNFGYYLWQWRYFKGESPSQIQNPMHIRFFTASFLKSIAREQGFEVLKIYCPVQRFKWLEKLLFKLKAQLLWEFLTQRWGKTLIIVLEKVNKPKFANLTQVMQQMGKW